MPITSGKKDYTNLTLGLVTEVNPLNFPEGASVDELNMNVDFSNLSRVRRRGLTSEQESTMFFDTEQANLTVFNTYVWKNAGDQSSVSILVVQCGNILTFWEATQPNISDNQHGFAYDLSESSITGSLTSSNRCQFSSVGGGLMVVREDINPTLLRYNPATSLTADIVSIRIRDIRGLDSGISNTEEPTTLTEEHQYNLYNQGWYRPIREESSGASRVDPVTTHFNTTGSYPSNADIIFQGMKADDQGDNRFNSRTLKDQAFGNTPAPKGHYIHNAFNIDREARRVNKSRDGSSFDDFSPKSTRGPLN